MIRRTITQFGAPISLRVAIDLIFSIVSTYTMSAMITIDTMTSSERKSPSTPDIRASRPFSIRSRSSSVVYTLKYSQSRMLARTASRSAPGRSRTSTAFTVSLAFETSGSRRAACSGV